MKKLITMILAVCMMLTTAPGVLATGVADNANTAEAVTAAALDENGAAPPGSPDAAFPESGAQPMGTPYEEPPEPRDVSASGTVTESISWTLEHGVLTVSGTGEIPNYISTAEWGTWEILERNDPPWTDYRNDVLEVRVEQGITVIGACAFTGMGNLEKVTIAGSVKTIWWDAFSNAWKLSEINLNEGTEQIMQSAFYNACPQTLTIPSTVTDMGCDTLNGLWHTENFVVAPGNPVYQSIDGVLFTDGGKTLFRYPAMHGDTYAVPEGTTKIAESGFSQNHLKSVTLPNSLTEIGPDAFSYSEELTSITIPAQVKRIEPRTFFWSNQLRDIYVPDGMLFIHADALPDGATVHACPASLLTELDDGSWARVIPTGIYGTQCYDDAFRVLELVNQERAANGVAPLKMDQSLLDTACLRSFELVAAFDHTRPNGTSCFTANKHMFGENIAAGSATPEGVMSQWMNSAGHRANILNPDFTSIGIACLRVNGRALWVQCFGTQLSTEAQRSTYPAAVESNATIQILADKEHYHPVFTAEKTELQVGEVAHVLALWMGTHMDDKGLVVESSAPDVIAVRDGVDFVAVGAGTAQITVCPIGAPDLAQTFTMRVKGSGTVDKGFSDVPADAWYTDAVTWAVDRGVTNGTSETTFSPDATCTRAQVVTFLWRVAGSPAPKADASFSDVQPGSYYEKAVQWAVAQGITNGVDAAHFAPDAPCTRAQVVTFLHRFANAPAAAHSNAFVDVPAGEWFSAAVDWAVSRSITNGMDATHFDPDGSCTRAQIVTFLYRYAGA